MAHPPASIKVLFLDIDGVICCNAYGRLEEAKLDLLKSIAVRTGCKVVLSTDWRRVPQLKAQVISTLKAYGIPCIGATPCRPNWLAVRPEEIVAWLKGYHAAPNAMDKPTISHWVAIDDRPLLQEQGGAELRGHFVRTKLAVGLTDRLAQRAVDILMGDEAAADTLGGYEMASTQPVYPVPIALEPATPTYALPKAQRTPVADGGRAHLSGYQTPPPAATHAHPSEYGADAKSAAAARAYALGRPPPAPAIGTPSSAAGARRSSVGTPPARFSASPSAGVGRSPVHVASQSPPWWNSRGPAGLASTGTGVAHRQVASPTSVYAPAGAGARRSSQ